MSNIAFTGIQDIKISRKQYSKPISLRLQNGVKNCTAEFLEVKIAAKLTDDLAGKDFSDFQKRLPDKDLYNPSNSDNVEFHMIKAYVNNKHVTPTLFNINGKPFGIYSDKDLPVMTFFARLTRQAAKNPDMSQNQIKYLDFLNKSIQKEAVHYIENK